jgi:2-keto-4-pentenoate hydratase/2-oxohepta-3-ene-1,7-dioic acid hydratase in catechol pathway
LKLINFTIKYQNCIGILLKNAGIICLENLNRIFTAHHDPMISLISQLPQLHDSINKLIKNVPQSGTKEYNDWRLNEVLLAPNEVKILSPILKPSKIIAIGLNYMDHCRETETKPPKNPIVFTKFQNTIIGTGDVIQWKSKITSKVDNGKAKLHLKWIMKQNWE